MIAILPVSLFGDDTAGAILHSNGQGVMVNHNPVPVSVALYPDDLIETQKNTVARIAATGSAADIDEETMVEFEPTELVLDHGHLSVTTSRGLRVRVGCVTITPVNGTELTHYDVIDLDGKVTVSALKDDVYIDERSKNPQEIKHPEKSSRSLVREGERKSREEKCAGVYLRAASISGAGAILNSPWAIGAGIAGIGVIACLGLFCKNDDPMSPSKP